MKKFLIKLFSCKSSSGKARQADKPKATNLDDQFEFLSIYAGESLFGTPMGSAMSADEAILEQSLFRSISSGGHVISLGTTTLNGIRYHPYSSMFGYTIAVPPRAGRRSGNSAVVPFDFSSFDEVERELQLWVRMHNKIVIELNALPGPVQKSVVDIYSLLDDELVVEPMEKLESLRNLLSHPHDTIDETERYLCLDFLVLDETLHRLRWKYPRVKNVVGLLDNLQMPGEEDVGSKQSVHATNDDSSCNAKSSSMVQQSPPWHYEEYQSIQVWTKEESDGSLSIQCRSVQDQPIFNTISLIYEVDLHPQFMPHLAKSIKLHNIPGCGKRANLLLRYIYKMPIPLAIRDIVLFAFGCNAMKMDGVNGIIIPCQSVPAGATSNWWGHSVPAEGADRCVRENVRGMAFILKPIGHNKTELTVISNLDKQVSFIPKSLMHWLIKDMIRGLYKNMVKLSVSFQKTEFANRVRDNPEFYNWVKKNIDLYLPNDVGK